MKLNLSGQGIKGLLLQHGEKIGMVVVGLCVALFLYSAAGRERLPADKQHDVLMQKVNASQQKINNYTWQEAIEASKEVPEGEEPYAKLPEPIPGTATAEVPVDQYVTAPTGWNPPVVPPTELRHDPELLAVTDLEVHGFSAIIPYVDEATRRRRAIEEAKRQEEERKKTEQRAADAARDAERGRGGRGREGGFGGPFGEGMMGGGFVDPNDPNKRMAPPIARAEGVDVVGDERLDIVYGVVVLGKVPVEEQQRAYRAALEHAKGGYDPLMRDRPHYIGAFVERAEVTDGGQELQWKTVMVRSGTGRAGWSGVSVNSLTDTVQDWPAEMEELADQRVIHPILTFPLPPLVGQNWGDRAKHSDAPLQADFDPAAAMEAAAQPEAAPAEGDGTDLFGPSAGQPGRVFGGEGRGGFGERARGGFSGGRGGFMGEGGGMGMRGGMMGMGGRGEFMGEGGMGGFGGRGGMGGARRDFGNMEEPMPELPYWMFRFFDMSAEPGKQYRYRVKLVLIDVNGHVRRNYLDREVLARLGDAPKPGDSSNPIMRQTEWSEPSPMASVPMAGEVRIASVTPAARRQVNAEPSVKLLVKSFDLDDSGKAIQAALEHDFFRGSVMNFIDDVEVLKGQFIEKVEDFNFRTGATLVDIRPGKQLAGEMRSPSKVLVMDAGGRLSVRDEVEDAGEVDLHRQIFAKPDPRDRNRGGFFGGGFEGEF